MYTDVVINLTEYKQFWDQLRIAIAGQISKTGTNAKTCDIELLIQETFGFKVHARPCDRVGTVIMDPQTFTWFTLKWGHM